MAHITGLELHGKDGVMARLSLGPMTEAINAMNACTEELLTHWGFDVAQHRTRKSGPVLKGYPAEWRNSNEYPKERGSAESQGIVWYRINVDEKGKPTACEVQQRVGDPDFGQHICRQMILKARFDPALDAAGKPMKSYTSIR